MWNKVDFAIKPLVLWKDELEYKGVWRSVPSGNPSGCRKGAKEWRVFKNVCVSASMCIWAPEKHSPVAPSPVFRHIHMINKSCPHISLLPYFFPGPRKQETAWWGETEAHCPCSLRLGLARVKSKCLVAWICLLQSSGPPVVGVEQGAGHQASLISRASDPL